MVRRESGAVAYDLTDVLDGPKWFLDRPQQSLAGSAVHCAGKKGQAQHDQQFSLEGKVDVIFRMGRC